MDLKFLLIILFGAVIFFGFSQGLFSLTGFEAFQVSHGGTLNITVNLSVENITRGEIFGITHDPSVVIYFPINITTGFVNTGSLPFTAQIKLTVLDTSFQELIVVSGGVFYYLPSDSQGLSITYYTNQSGIHIVKAEGLENGNDLMDQKFTAFLVTDPSGQNPGTNEPDTSGGAGTPTQNETRASASYGFATDYRTNISVLQGQTILFPITVSNTGNRPLTNISVFIKQVNGLPITIYPATVNTIEENKSALFMADLHIPLKTPPGRYDFVMNVSTNELDLNDLKFYVHVRESELKDVALNTLLNYIFLANTIEIDIFRARQEGYDVSKAVIAHKKALDGIELSTRYFRDSAYQLTLNELDEVRIFLIVALNELAAARAGPQQFILPGYVPLLGYVILILLVILIPYFYMYYQKRRKKRQKILEDQLRI